MSWCDEMEGARLLIAPSIEKDIMPISREGCLLSLRHPKSGVRTTYMFIDGLLLEFQWFKQSYGSWFVGDYVCEDGSLYVSTPVDPIFILLPLFEDARMKKGNDLGMFRQLEEILYVDVFPCYRQLISTAENCMHLICDVKEIGSSRFYRLNNSKVLAWLCHKVNSLKAALAKLDKNFAAQDERNQSRDAISLLGDYLREEPWLMLLCTCLKLNIDEVHHKVSKTEFVPISSENDLGASHTTQGKNSTGKYTPSNGTRSKKLKTKTDSQNIKDMFRRVTRSGSITQ